MSAPQSKLLSTLGLCARARGLVTGTPMVCDAMRAGATKGKQTVLAVLVASDASANTKEKLTSKCTYYGVPLYCPEITVADMGRAVGKSGLVAAVGITHEGLWRALSEHLSATASSDMG